MKPIHAAIRWLACALWAVPALASADVPSPEVDHHQLEAIARNVAPYLR